MATVPPLDEIIQRLLDAIVPLAERFDALQAELAGIPADNGPVQAELAAYLDELLSASGDSLTALFAGQLDLQNAVADSFFPVQ